MENKVFVYGTLMIPAVMEVVIGKQLESTDAVLDGYARYRLKGRVYPGIIEAPNHTVDGRVYQGIDNSTLRRLDAFEADEYQRKRVAVTTDNRVRMTAYTYVITPAHAMLLSKHDWDIDGFVKKHLTDYLQRI